jgi:hypothetical protein
MGCPIQTITASGGIQVGEDSYPRQGDWVQLLVLDPVTLVPVQCGQPRRTCDIGFDADETSRLLSTLDEIEPRSDDLVILSGQGIAYQDGWPNYVGHGFTAAQVAALKAAFEKLGGTLAPGGAARPNGAESLNVGAWSLLGRVGATGGFAEQNYTALEAGIPGFLGESGGGRGSLNGYLQIVNSAAYEFVSPEYVDVDTSASGSSATENVITVGDHTYRSDPIQSGEQAFQILFLPNEPDAYSSEPQHVYNTTIVTRHADGTLDQEGIGAFAYLLYVLRTSGLPAQWFTIVQSFGATDEKGRQQISDSPDWVADQLPEAGLSRPEHDEGEYDFYRWCGNGEEGHTGERGEGTMNGEPCKPFPNAPTAFGSARTVTQAIGELAGMRARDEVANLGFQGQPEALAMIGPAYPYSDGDAKVAVGAAGERMVGVLRRSRQAQWTVAAASPGLTDNEGHQLFEPAAFWETTFGAPHEAWPVSGPPGSSLGEAGRYIAEKLFPEQTPPYTEVRQAYATAPAWIDSKPAELAGIGYPAAQRPHFGRADFEALKNELLDNEFPKLKAIDTMTEDYQKLFGTAQLTGLIDFKLIQSELISKALKDNAAYEKQTATVDEGPSVGSALYFAADAIGLFPPAEEFAAPIGFFASAYDFFSELYGSSESTGTAKQPFGEPQQISDEAAKLTADLSSRYQTLSATFEHFEVLFDTDWGRLHRAAENATGKWSLPASSSRLHFLQQSLATAGQAGLYEALVPLAYDQWVVSPWYTDAGGDENNEGPMNVGGTAGPREYHCDGPTSGPFDGFPDSSLAWVRFEANSAGGQKNHFTGRALVSKAGPLVLRQDEEVIGDGAQANYPGVVRNGAPPEAALTEKLFDEPTAASNPSEPDGLGLSKVGFLGLSTWNMPRLQCGMPLAFAPPE